MSKKNLNNVVIPSYPSSYSLSDFKNINKVFYDKLTEGMDDNQSLKRIYDLVYDVAFSITFRYGIEGLDNLTVGKVDVVKYVKQNMKWYDDHIEVKYANDIYVIKEDGGVCIY